MGDRVCSRCGLSAASGWVVRKAHRGGRPGRSRSPLSQARRNMTRTAPTPPQSPPGYHHANRTRQTPKQKGDGGQPHPLRGHNSAVAPPHAAQPAMQQHNNRDWRRNTGGADEAGRGRAGTSGGDGTPSPVKRARSQATALTPPRPDSEGLCRSWWGTYWRRSRKPSRVVQWTVEHWGDGERLGASRYAPLRLLWLRTYRTKHQPGDDRDKLPYDEKGKPRGEGAEGEGAASSSSTPT